jgi:hypothetical protein
MLNPTTLLNWIKQELGHPYFAIERTDEELLTLIRENTLPLFSQYVPLTAFKQLTSVDLVPGTPNEYLLNDPDGVVSINDVLLPITIPWTLGHPWLLMPSFDELPSSIMDLHAARSRQLYSIWRHNWEFIPPNRLRIYPSRLQNLSFLVRYEKVHVSDFSTIPIRFNRALRNLALADVLENIASVRSKYQTMSTPFGEITLNVEDLRTRAETLRTTTLEELKSLPPNTIVEVG